MKYYKDPTTNQVYAYELDGSQDGFILPELVPMTDQEVEAHLAPAPVSPPEIVSMRQARIALLQAGLLDSVNAAVAAGSEADKITWEYATEVRRDDALVQNLSVSLGLSSEQLDTLFTTASNL